MTNVKLSKEELALVTDAELILTKNRIIQKVYELFGELSEEYKQFDYLLPREIISVQAKISKGENYLELPWVMLDYPRKFSQTNVFAVRCFFWWGNFFSITLQLQGSYQHQYAPAIEAKLRNKDWLICNDTSNAWQHHFHNDHYIAFSNEININQFPFLKIAKKIPLQQWDKSFDFFVDCYKELMQALRSQTVE